MKEPSNGFIPSIGEEPKVMNSELWHACAGPLVSVPPAGSLVVYFPQGHSEQVAASMQKEIDSIPSYPNLPSKLICMLHNVVLHADTETDEVYAQMTLQPVNKYDRDALIASEMALKQNRQPAEFFCKTLTASDTSTHGGFSVPRRAAEKIFPPLDFSMQPPAQEIVAKDLHGYTWTFRHIYRGQPKRHLLTTGWSVFVSSKRLFAGDSVLFIRDEKSQLLLGIRRANRQQPALASSVISSDSMHIGILASAAHAAANNSPFTIFYNPRASPAEFVVPFAKYNKAMYTQVSLGMRFRMMFETEECGVRRYMGTITGISDFDPVRWKNSQWRNLQVGWDESTAGERPSRVSIWDIEPVVTPFYICPPPFLRPRFTRQPDDESDMENMFKRSFPWLGDEFGTKDVSSSIFPGLSLVQWMSMQQNNQFAGSQPGFLPAIVSPTVLHGSLGTDDPSKFLNFQSPSVSVPNLQFSKATQQNQLAQLQQQQPTTWPQQQLHQLQNPLNSHQQQPQQQQLTPEQQAIQQQLQKQQIARSTFANSSLVSPTHDPSQSMQLSPVSANSQVHQQQLVGGNQVQQNVPAIKDSVQLAALPPDMQFQHQTEQTNVLQCLQQHQQLQQQQQQQQQTQLQQSSQQLSHETLSPRPPILQPLSKHQLQLQLLQKLQQHQPQPQPQTLQQQQQHFMSPIAAQLQPQVSIQQLVAQQNQIGQNRSLSSNQMQTSLQIHGMQKTVAAIRSQSGPTDVDTPLCSTSPSTNNCQIPSSCFVNHAQQARNMQVDHSVVEPNGFQDVQDKSHVRIKHEITSTKVREPPKFNGTIVDPLEASSSVTSYGLDPSGIQQNLSLPSFGLDGDIQSHPRNNLSLSTAMDSMTPDTLLSRGFDSGKELHNLLSNHNGATELSAGAMSSQSFGVPNMPFNSGCSNDVAVNDPAVFNGGMFPSQTQRMRTFTKVQKRGSVGRSIDVTRYKGYDELRRDLARMFGIEGQMEDPQRSDWKLIYVDHENDILLVGDDPWDEFVNCVQSIKILSSSEVQQMSLDGDFGNGPVPNQASSGTDSGNVWRGLYEDNSAVSFNR